MIFILQLLIVSLVLSFGLIVGLIMGVDMKDEKIIVFDNLVHADPQGEGHGEQISAQVLSGDNIEPFVQPNARGELYHPSSLEDVKVRARGAGRRFKELFQS